jgi:hypothetical protein
MSLCQVARSAKAVIVTCHAIGGTLTCRSALKRQTRLEAHLDEQSAAFERSDILHEYPPEEKLALQDTSKSMACGPPLTLSEKNCWTWDYETLF